MRTTLSVGALLVMSGITPTYAHHSLTEYDVARPVTLNAVVREFRFVNPHPFLLVDARVDDVAQVWRLELDNRFELVEIGMNSNTFARGDRLVVTGPAGHDRKPILYVRELRRTNDGFRYEQPDTTPRIVARPAKVD